MLVEDALFVMPRADAGVGLPRQRLGPRGDAAFDVEQQGAALVRIETLRGDHGFQFAVAREVGVVEVGGDAQADVGGGIDGQHRVVKIQQVGMVLVDQVDDAVEELLAVGLRQRGTAALGPGIAAGRVILRVVILRIEALPPKALAVGFAEEAVIGHARERTAQVGLLGILIPAPGAVAVAGEGEAQAGVARGARPAADDVFFRSDRDAVPRLELRVEHVEVVVVVGHGREILRAGALVEADEVLGIPVLGLPLVDHILEAEL